MEIIGLFVHLETVAVTAVIFLFCSQVELVFPISQLQGASESGHSGLPPRPSEGWVTVGTRQAEPQQALGQGRLASFSLPIFTPSRQAGTGWTECCGFCTAERREPNPSRSPRAAMSTHSTLCPLQGPFQSSQESGAMSPFSITFIFSQLLTYLP